MAFFNTIGMVGDDLKQAITQAEHQDAASYDPRFPEHLRLAITRVHRDEKAIAQLEAECQKVNQEIETVLYQLQQKAA